MCHTSVEELRRLNVYEYRFGQVRCPQCSMVYEATGTVEAEPTFNCPGCKFEFCRRCDMARHPGTACETTNQTNERLSSEELASLAAMTKCPDCPARFVKEHGCNKMTCRCGAIVCFVCGDKIPKSVGYKHYCQHPTDPGAPCPENCGKCSLWKE